MGSFIGHAIPGSLFFLFGLWCVTQALRRHFRCRQSRQPFFATLTYSCGCCPLERLRSLPVESLLKIILSFLGIIVEIIGGTNHISHRFDSVGNTQHITMYAFFALSGVADLLVLGELAPRGADYVSAMLALLVEGLLFHFHVWGRPALDVLLHTLLLYLVLATVVVVGLEAAFRQAPLLPVLRGLLFMLQGTWFWGVGFILYNPLPGATPWQQEDHHALMLAVVCFSWHLAANLLLVVAVGGAIFCCHGNKAHYSKLSTVPLDVLEKGEEQDLFERGVEQTAVGAGTGAKENGTLLSIRDDDDYSDCCE